MGVEATCDPVWSTMATAHAHRHPGPPVAADGPERVRLARQARLLSWASLVWVTAEGVVGIWAGIAAGSIALIGWGLGSAIEGLASVIVIWRFSGGRTFDEDAEHRAFRLVAISFFLLAPYVAIASISRLISGEHAQDSLAGIIVTASAVVLMPVLGVAKQRLGARLGSPATRGEGRQNMLCAAQAAAVFVGLVANALWGAWWLDPIAGLVIAAIAVREGREAWRGEGCLCAAPVIPGADDCCAEAEA
jgi:divalent metal cation (Fe/Co/Zn/Cd) transporter